jgi:hypothetical protein
MARREVNTADIKIAQQAPINLAIADTSADRPSEIIKGDGAMAKKDFDELAFNEEPVTIVIEQSSEKNSPHSYYCAVNGKGAEVLINGRWCELAWLPVGQALTIKRKYVGVLLRAKTTRVETIVPNAGDSDLEKFPGGKLMRFTSGLCTFSIVQDKNERGADWAMSLRQQNF